jgi:hypothetical protein
MNKYGNKLRKAKQCCSIALLTFLIAAAAHAQTPATETEAARTGLTSPPVPADLQVETGNKVFLIGHAVGTQNYVCLPCDPSTPGCEAGVAFSLFTPQATLFNDHGKQLITHFFSPNPFEGNLVRATWEHSQDTSRVWAKAIGIATDSTDPQFVRQGAIPWVLLQVKDVGALAGPTGGNKLTGTTFIQRVNTFGGSAPAGVCNSPANIGIKAFVPYTADYIFYKDAGGDSRNDY